MIFFHMLPADHPGILIEGRDGRSGRTQNQAHAKSNRDFDVGKVGHDLVYRPFVGSGAFAQFPGGHAFDQACELLRCGSLDRERLLSF